MKSTKNGPVSSKVIFEEFKAACDGIKKTSPALLQSAGFGMLATINGYRERYPLHKIITKDKVEEICKKYGLLMAELHRFVGDVPENKVNDIIQFKQNCEYRFVYKEKFYRNEEDVKAVRKQDSFFKRGYIKELDERKYYICAPANQISLNDKATIKKGYIVTDDPIVLFTENRWGDNIYAVVAAWGDEAKDVVNENAN